MLTQKYFGFIFQYAQLIVWDWFCGDEKGRRIMINKN